MSTINSPSTPESTFAAELAAARIAALRSLVETLTTTDDPVEKRRIATSILRIPNPATAPRPAKARRSAEPPENHVPAESPGPAPVFLAVAESDDDSIPSVVSSPAIDLLSPFSRFKAIDHNRARPRYTCAAGP